MENLEKRLRLISIAFSINAYNLVRVIEIRRKEMKTEIKIVNPKWFSLIYIIHDFQAFSKPIIVQKYKSETILIWHAK